ncbi:hypothetical protein SDC9_172846 [bioreactor metagenome]|uniref:Uncharacterized protein n=1 Tax=bioreactor metagenome TaxID=1076179 RepID=A0A645GEU3_9ZZZZ
MEFGVQFLILNRVQNVTFHFFQKLLFPLGNRAIILHVDDEPELIYPHREKQVDHVIAVAENIRGVF